MRNTAQKKILKSGIKAKIIESFSSDTPLEIPSNALDLYIDVYEDISFSDFIDSPSKESKWMRWGAHQGLAII